MVDFVCGLKETITFNIFLKNAGLSASVYVRNLKAKNNKG